MTPPVQPVPPTAPAAPAGLDLNTRVAHGDTRFPKELWGKTLGEAMRFYSIMREDFMRRNDPSMTPAGQPAPAAAPAAPAPTWQPPAGRSVPTPPAAPAASAPIDAASMQSMIEQAVARALGPVVQAQSQTLHEQMRSRVADWMTYDQEILESLAGTPASMLADPETWMTAYYFVKGRKLSQSGAPAPTAPPTRDWNSNPFSPPVVAPPPAPPVTGQPHFVEGPSAPSGPASNASAMSDPRVHAMAHRFGMPVEEYIQWMGGNVPAMPGGNGHV